MDPLALINQKLIELCAQMSTMREDMGAVKADLVWLKKGYWLLAAVVLASASGHFLFK